MEARPHETLNLVSKFPPAASSGGERTGRVRGRTTVCTSWRIGRAPPRPPGERGSPGRRRQGAWVPLLLPSSIRCNAVGCSFFGRVSLHIALVGFVIDRGAYMLLYMQSPRNKIAFDDRALPFSTCIRICTCTSSNRACVSNRVPTRSTG